MLDDYANIVAVIIFIVASLTDFLDGYIARSRNLVSNFGKFMDPLADKLLVTSALIYFVEAGIIPAWVIIIIVSREFAISGIRVMAAKQNRVIAASWWGKIKTAVTMVMIIVILFDFKFSYINYIEMTLIVLATGLTIISGLDYIIKNAEVLKDKS
jgi:CDP-diacylglycerol--glycerol-3-phosphate 3-phosphatidyltransferase